ncbi:MAG TPA: APC family permease [Acidobacteriaceae bacterium]|nr:APC family permease [Acidobacteriaceae bacterium]
MTISDLLFGRPLASDEERAEKIGAVKGIPIFGLDALSSAAYGPEAALTLLIPLGMAGTHYLVPITAAILILLTILYFSYRQTIAAYPNGGGSYTVATENLGRVPGLLAGAALMVDYILEVAVGIAAGVGALVSGFPKLQPHTLALCLGILAILTIMNLRGARAAGAVFMAPTYLFIVCLLVLIGWGAVQTVLSGGHPHPVIPPPQLGHATQMVSLWILLKAFSSGCTAMTGVEAVSNGVAAFKEPHQKSAQLTLTIIIILLGILLAGIGLLVPIYHIAATDPSAPGYQSVLSQLLTAITGRGIFYYVTIGSILVVLALSANTGFADFPRLCHNIARDRFLPFAFTLRGRRLVYSGGVYVLATVAALLLVVFDGVTDRLIPLFAIGAFLAFTLSQAGMVMHWRRVRGKGWQLSLAINGIGAIATGITVCVVLATKFTSGAWITAIVIPAIILMMLAVHRHYLWVTNQVAAKSALDTRKLEPPIVVMPIPGWSRITSKALRIALSISHDIYCVHVKNEEGEQPLEATWRDKVIVPMEQAGLPPPHLIQIESPTRRVITPILDQIIQIEQDNPSRQLLVMLPELIENRWYYYLLHNQRGAALKTMLYLKGTQRIIVANVPWYLDPVTEDGKNEKQETR